MPEEVLKSESSLPLRKEHFRVLGQLLVVVVHLNFHQSRGEHFLQRHRVVLTHQEDMLVLVFAVRLLGQISRGKVLAVYELACCVDRFVSMLRFIWYILDCHQVYLKGIQFLGKEVRQKCLVGLNLYVQVMNRLGHELIKFPFKLDMLLKLR